MLQPARIFLGFIFYFYLCACMCMHTCKLVPRMPCSCSYSTQCGRWELNTSLKQEQQVLFTSEPAEQDLFLQITSALRVPRPVMGPGGSSSGRRPQRDLGGGRRWPGKEQPASPLLITFLSASGVLVIESRPHEWLANAPTHTEIPFTHSSEFCFIIQAGPELTCNLERSLTWNLPASAF